MFLESSESYREHIGDKYYEDTNIKSINSSSTTLHITTTEKKSLMNIKIVKIYSNFFDDN